MKERIKNHERDIALARAHNSAISNTTMKQDTFLLRARLGLLIIAFPGTLEGLKKTLTYGFILRTRVGITESKSLKHGCKLSKTMTADQKQNPTMRDKYIIDGMTIMIEMHQ